MFKKLINLLLVSTMLLCALSASADGISGTFSGKGTGYGGTISVDVTLNDGTITTIEVTGSNETAGIGTVAMDKLIPEIIETQSVDLDAVSGATRASEGLLAAVSAALEASGADIPT